jgi:hypothetical protein
MRAIYLAVALALASGAAHAAVYVCTLGGRTITGDTPPAECSGVPIRELNPDGTVKRLIGPPLVEPGPQLQDLFERNRRSEPPAREREYQERMEREIQQRLVDI